MLHIAGFEEIKRGDITDVYFLRTREILEAKGIDVRVRAQFMAKNLPNNWPWAVLAGLEEVFSLYDDLDINVRVMPEGSFFRPFEPVMEIEGRYLEFGHLETAILGLICQATGVATTAARCRAAAGEKRILSFGARRMHPAIAPMLERNAWIGGCDGVAVGKGAELVGIEPSGTIPHVLILLLGDTVEATLAFAEIIDEKIPRISLIDTFNDEKFEAVRVAKALGDKLDGVRLDTPGSRRGDFASIIKEVRWELDLAGFQDVKIVASGGLNEDNLAELAPLVDTFGVGGAISSAPIVDFSMDIVEIDGKAISKRGVMSGSKDVYRCKKCNQDTVAPRGVKPDKCNCGGEWATLLKDHKKGSPTPSEIRDHVLKQLHIFKSEIARPNATVK